MSLQSRVPPDPPLRGRGQECSKLEALVRAAQDGRSSVLVLLGEPGIGKTALMRYLEGRCDDCQVLRVTGVESQMELAFAGLHQLCRPLLGNIDRLPPPQADALRTTFGLSSGTPPDRFLVGLAVLTLLSESARDKPLICLIDDAQWLDQASIQTLTFVGRRLQAEAIVMLVAARPGVAEDAWQGLPQSWLTSLPESEAAALLEANMPGGLDPRVRDRLVAETRGNPLALVELPRWFTPTEMNFGPDHSETRSVQSRLQKGFLRQLDPLPPACRRLLLVAAAEPTGDVSLMWRAAQRLGIGLEGAIPAEASGILELRQTVQFRHPLLRSVTYWSAPAEERRLTHQALADVTDPDTDADRRAWHLARAATEPEERVAAELERCAARAVRHGGLVAAATFLAQAALLTPDVQERSRRQLDAAQLMLQAGDLDAGLHLVALAEHGPLSDLQRARMDVLRAQFWFASHRGDGALSLLLAAARRLEALHLESALDTYVDALTAALFAGRLAVEPGAAEVGRAASAAPMPPQPRRGDTLLQAVATRFADSYSAAVPLLRQAVQAFNTDEVSLEEGVRFMWLSAVAATDLWDDQTWDRLTLRHLETVRDAGALSALPLALNTRVFVELFAGNLLTASGMVNEIDAAAQAAQVSSVRYGAIGVAAFHGHDDEAAPLIAAAMTDVARQGEGIGVALTHWAKAMLCNGLGRYSEALDAARVAAQHPGDMGVANWALSELVEAAVRAGEQRVAAEACARLSVMTKASGTEWALGVAARCSAQLEESHVAENLYQEAIERLSATRVQVERARAQLVYGEWLRRVGRRVDARKQLRAAYDTLADMHVDAFADRARRELVATGETVRKRTPDTRQHLTAQELHIARLAADGLTNPEIATALFISPRTVEWHLRKVFAKLGVTARRQLRESLRPTMG